MELIQSFAVDHTKIIPGIFVSRQDTIGDEVITTYDIRLKRPNVEPAIDVAAMHSLEHIIATFLRNDEEYKDEIIYWGPMGCLTGFYLILKGNRSAREIYSLVLRAFEYASMCDNVPGNTAECCGNCHMHNLRIAKHHAKQFYRYMLHEWRNPRLFEYPKTERFVTEEGQQFFDS